MDDTGSNSPELKRVRRSKAKSTSLSTETKGHTSSPKSLDQLSTDITLSNTYTTKYGIRTRPKDDKYSIITRNKSLGLVNGVPTKVDLPIVPYGSTLRRLEKRKQVKELSEDDYVACMENIIERDYFPDLLKYRYLKAISDAENAGNKRLAEKLEKELEMIKSGQVENNVYLKTLGDENIVVNLGKDGLKLDEFNRIFSSEDNRSFDRLMEKDIENKIAKTKWIEDTEYKHNLAISDVQKKTNLGIKSDVLQTNRFEARNSLYFTPEYSNTNYSTTMATNYTSNSISTTSNTNSNSNRDGNSGNNYSNSIRIRDNRSTGVILAKNTNLGLDQKDLDEMADMQLKRTKELKQREENEKLSDLIASEGVSKNKELVQKSSYGNSYVFTPKIIAGQSENEPIFTWGTISSLEQLPPTPGPDNDYNSISTTSNSNRDGNNTNYSSNRIKRLLRGDQSVKEGKEFNMPKPLEREEIANKLYKKLKTPKTPINPNTPYTPKTPLIVQKLIEKHTKNVDVQLRDSYSGKKYKSSRASSMSSRK